MSLKNKVVIVTGASSGIGAAAAELFAKEGADLALVGRNVNNLKEVSNRCEALGVTTLIIKAEMTNDDDVKSVVEKTIAKFNKLDVLVNNAGILSNGSLLDGKLMQDFDKVMNVNLRSVVFLTTLAIPYLEKTKGNIVNVSSILGFSFIGSSGYMTYCLTKAALSHFSRGAALELSSVGIRVNTVSPGPTKTNVLKTAGFDNSWEKIQEFYKINRVSEPEEVGDLIIFLASDKARSITGADYVIDIICTITERLKMVVVSCNNK